MMKGAFRECVKQAEEEEKREKGLCWLLVIPTADLAMMQI
jgi:hypothetical protein